MTRFSMLRCDCCRESVPEADRNWLEIRNAFGDFRGDVCYACASAFSLADIVHNIRNHHKQTEV